MTRSSVTRPAPRFAPRTMTGTHRFFNDRFHRFHNRPFFNNRFHRFHNQNTFVFVDTFGFPFFYPYPYPYYGYYPYGYYGGYNGYGYGNASTVIEVQRRLARAGYYHGRIDGIMGPQTRRAIRAYERDHDMSAYGVIDRQLLVTMGLV
jgi:Putative peptidoglycan binding domain